jgi:hypothetical protein
MEHNTQILEQYYNSSLNRIETELNKHNTILLVLRQDLPAANWRTTYLTTQPTKSNSWNR